MVQQFEAYEIPLEGRGYTVRNSGDYRDGEYKQLHNVELLDGRLQQRRDIRAIPSEYSQFESNSIDSGFIGSFGRYAVYSGPNCQYAVSSHGDMQPMWNP